MYSLISVYIIVPTILRVTNSFEIDYDCSYRLGDRSKNVSWKLNETLQMEFFVSQNWKGNYYLEMKQYQQSLEIELTFISAERLNFTNYIPLNYEAFGWNNFSLEYELTNNSVILSGYQIKPQSNVLTITPDANNNIGVVVKVQKPDFMYVFINCTSTDERSFYIPGNGTEFVLPVSFYLDRTRLIFYSEEDFRIILNGVNNYTGKVYLCQNFLDRQNLVTFPFCNIEFSKNIDYSWDLSVADINQNLIKDKTKTIKMESENSPFYVKTNKSFKKNWWGNNSESVPKSDYYQPLIVVSSVFSAIMIAGVIIFYIIYKRKLGVPTVQENPSKEISSEGTNLLKTFEPPPLPPFPKPSSDPRGPESFNREGGKDWIEYKPPPIGPAPVPPPLAKPLEDDGSITVVYPGYEEPDYWAEKYGTYENPRVT